MRGFSRLRALRHGFSPLKVSFANGSRIARASNILFEGKASFGFGVSITARGGRIIFGKNFSANEQVILNADIGGNIVFGENCLVGPRAIFRTSNHNYADFTKIISDQGHKWANITIGKDVWIGAGVIVLPGVTIGDRSVIGAGAVVTKNIPDNSIAVGVPAKVIKTRTN